MPTSAFHQIINRSWTFVGWKRWKPNGITDNRKSFNRKWILFWSKRENMYKYFGHYFEDALNKDKRIADSHDISKSNFGFCTLPT